jgi:hypothetical protein
VIYPLARRVSHPDLSTSWACLLVWSVRLLVGGRSIKTGSREITMTLHSSNQTFVFEIIGVDLFIQFGRYELSWDRNGFCVCKGMETLWANWH